MPVLLALALSWNASAEPNSAETPDGLYEIVAVDDADAFGRVLELGVSPDEMVPAFGSTTTRMGMLELACRCASEKCIRLLLWAGADKMGRGQADQLPIEVLLDQGREDLAELVCVADTPMGQSAIAEHLVYLQLDQMWRSIEYPRTCVVSINGRQPSVELSKIIAAREAVLKLEMDAHVPLGGGGTTVWYRRRFGYWLVEKIEPFDR